MTRSNTDPLYELDLELELTLCRLRKARKIVVNNSRSSNSFINFNQLSIDISVSSFSHFAEPGQMENNDRTLKELATPDVVYQPWRRPPQALKRIPRTSINVMPASIYRALNFGDLEPIGMIIQLANRSIVQPLGILKDVLVQVNELIFPAELYVLDMEDETFGKESTLIMGRPLLMTARAKIDVHEQEDKLLEVLRQHKKAIRWKLSDLLGINLSICMHRILMEEEIKPIRQQQRRLNPTILDVVKKEVTKLLAVGIIYPISDSQWVSPVQVMPKKSGMTITKNQHDELVPTRIQNSWLVCIDYRRLNQATHKDHFPLPFIDQVLEKLSRKSHYCFLDGFLGYMQIHIAPEDQHKTTFTYPFGTFAYTRMPFGLCNAPSTLQR
ncbi:hypothetical protein CR513_24219, partial [Mucuna pruriens]